ncbi:MAG: hypothetical protein IH987_11705 [Planctomycetes bacterium]|nr:hypothetical protein [Planctomycetota bacterium]
MSLFDQVVSLAITLWLLGLLVAFCCGANGAYLYATPFALQRWCLRQMWRLLRFGLSQIKAATRGCLRWIGKQMREW